MSPFCKKTYFAKKELFCVRGKKGFLTLLQDDDIKDTKKFTKELEKCRFVKIERKRMK